MKTLFTIILLSFTTLPPPVLWIEGKWQATSAFNEDGEACEEKITNAFKITLLPDKKCEVQQWSWDQPNPFEWSGDYQLTSKALILTFIIGASSNSITYPIVEQSNDRIVLDYNLCALRDSLSNAVCRLTLERIK